MVQNILITGLCLILGIQTLKAQEYKAETKGAKKVMLTQMYGKIDLQEYDGNQIIITVDDLEEVSLPEKAEGLKPISQYAEDNTTLGLNIENDGSIITIKAANKQSAEGKYLIKTPKGISVVIDYKNPYTYGDVDIDGFSAELEISTMNDDINLKNVTGPLVLHSINGNINIEFSSVNQESPISVVAVNGEIDMHVPSSTPAKIIASTLNGEIYTNFDIDFEKKEKEGLTYIGGGQKISGNINNGGVEITLKSINDNIYLRKK